MTTKEQNNLRLRGALAALQKLDPSDPPDVIRDTLRRVKRTVAGCQASSNLSLAREISARLLRLAQRI